MIDHAERRGQVCEIAAAIIAREGVEGISFRNVAKEAGCSTRIVSHYFRNKRDLLLMTFRSYALQTITESEVALTENTDLQTILLRILPLDAERRRNWQVWLAFWGMAANDPEFLAEQVLRSGQLRKLIEQILLQHYGAAKSEDQSWEFISERIITLIVGLATQALFDPQRWTEDKQSLHLREALKLLLPPW